MTYHPLGLSEFSNQQLHPWFRHCRERHAAYGVEHCSSVRGGTVAVVLIVEDDEHVRMLAESILREAGHETCSAATATEAHAIIESEKKLDLLFVDLSLLEHHEEGLEVALAAVKVHPGLPVIYTTGRGITDGMLALFVQPNVFLAKPYNGEQLLTATANLLK